MLMFADVMYGWSLRYFGSLQIDLAVGMTTSYCEIQSFGKNILQSEIGCL